MRESNIPKILKTIYIQVDDEDEIATFNQKLSEIIFSKFNRNCYYKTYIYSYF